MNRSRRSKPRAASELALSIMLLTALGCPASEPGDGSANARDRTSASPRARSSADSATAAEPEWYRRARALDVTGDGKLDSIQLDAVGRHPDSLQISFTIRVDGQEKLRETWGSSYELALVDSAARRPPRVDAVLRARLDTVLASVSVGPLGAPGMRLMAEDSAALAGLGRRPTHGVSFAYGYETTVRLVWDVARERFVRLWSCC